MPSADNWEVTSAVVMEETQEIMDFGDNWKSLPTSLGPQNPDWLLSPFRSGCANSH